jgi:hypothetical protein
MDLNKLSDADLIALRDNKLNDMSDAGLRLIAGVTQPEPKKGIVAGLTKGVLSPLSSIRTGIESIFPEENAAENAAIKGIQRQEDIGGKYASSANLEKVKEAYGRGLLPAIGEVVSQVPGAIAEQLPQIGAMATTARLGAAAGSVAGPGGALFGGVVGAAVPLLAQFYGTNIERQAQEQIKSGDPVKIDRGNAALAAAPQAALDMVQARLLFGSKLIGKALGVEGKSLAAMSADKVEKLAAEKLIPTLIKGTGKGVVAEIPTEIGQQMIERAQAGLSITSPEALAEYGDTAYQVGLLGPLGAVGRISEKGQARAEVAGRKAADEAITADQQTQVVPPTGITPPQPTLPGAPVQASFLEAGPTPPAPPTAEAADPELLGRLRQQYDVLEREIDRLAQQFEAEQDPAKKLAIKVQAQKYDYARQEIAGQLQGAEARPGTAPVEGQAELDFTQPYPKDRLQAEPTIIGEKKATPDQQAIELEFAKQRLQAGAPLTPAQQLLLRQDKAPETAAPQLELPMEVGAGARPTSFVVDDKAINTFGLSKAATKLRSQLRGLDLMKEDERAKFEDAIAKHERKNAKIDMQAVEDFKAAIPQPVPAREVPEAAGLPAREYTPRQQYQQAREAMFAFGQQAAPISPKDRALLAKQQFEAKNGTPIPDAGTRTSEPSVQLPSGEQQPAAGTTAPTTAGLASPVTTTGRTTAGEGRTGKAQPTPLNPFAQMAQQLAPEGKAKLKDEKTKRVKVEETTDELLNRLGVKLEGDLQGKSTINLADRITQGDLKGALQEIATSKQFTPLDNLVAKRLLQAKTLPKVEIVSLEVTGGYPAQYDPNTDTVQIAEGNVDSHTVLHETVHGFLHVMIKTSDAREAKGLGGNPKLKNLKDIYNHVKNKRPDLVDKYGMKDLSEFASEVMSNPDFQNDLRNTPYRKTNVFTEFGRAVLRLLGIVPEGFSATDIDSLTAALVSTEQALSTGRKTQEDVQGGVRQQIEPQIAKVQRTQAGTQAEQLMDAFGGRQAAGPTSYVQQKQDSFNKAKDAWQESYERNQSRVAATFGKGQNIASFDQAFNNRLYNHFMDLVKKGDKTLEQAKQALIRISISQALHRGNLANQIIDRGNYDYDATTNRWTSVEDPVNMKAFEGLIRSLADKLGVEPNRARQIMGAAYEANRLKDMYAELNKTTTDLAQAEADLKTIKDPKQRATKKSLIQALEDKQEELNKKVQHKTPEQVAAGMELYNAYPEIAEGTKVWNTMRERVVKLLVDTGVKTQEQAEKWLEEAAYVPFFRDISEEKAAGPQVMARGIRESMKDFRMKGSQLEVHDPIENMYQWMQWSIARGISNKQLQVMLDQYKSVLPDEVAEGKGDAGNTFSVYRDGVMREYHVADPAIAQAFTGMEPIVFPGIGMAVGVTNNLRHLITRNPLFSAAQLFSDSYTAMFTSGLKHPFALLKEIAKEVSATAQGTSTTREALKAAGILETHDYSAMNEADALGQRLNLNEPSKWRKTMSMLDRLSSASDNVIRQGIYNQSIKEGLSHAEAMEKAAEIVNFRRISGDPRIQFLSRIVPFFNAYMQVTSVAIKTLTGRGISPQERMAAEKVLLATTAKVAMLSLLYSMAIGDDEDYLKKNRVSRDRMWMIPGTGGMGIPVRADIFVLPKIASEYTYQMMSDKGTTDGKMFKDAIKRSMVSLISPPSEGIPQIARPIIEIATNHDFFQDREIVNATMRRLDADKQYNKNTTEFSKALGSMTGMSPLMLDHFFRGYFGSAVTLGALATNDLINAARGNPPRPEMSVGQMLGSLPNMSGFMSKEENTAVLSDFYEVARDVNKAVATFSSMKYAPKEERQAYAEEHNKELRLKNSVQAISNQLLKLKQHEQAVREMPESRMSAERKQAELKRIDEARSKMTANIAKIRRTIYD